MIGVKNATSPAMALAFVTCQSLLANIAAAAPISEQNGASHCAAQPVFTTADAVDQIASRVMRQSHIPGMSLAVVQKGKVSRISSYGWSNIELCVRAAHDSLFGIGSISKQFTAAGVMLLVDSGKLSLDDPIVRYLPEGANRWQGIKIRNLLTHTSGIKDYVGDDTKYDSIQLDRSANISTARLVRLIARAPLNFKPGTDWAYSNTGYLLLSVIVERVSRMPFPRFMHDKVFAPLGMSSTRYYSPRELIPNRAAPYHIDDSGVVTNAQYISDQFSRWGDMGMLSTANDMAKWAITMMSGSIFPASVWKNMKTPVRLNDGSIFPYGFGLDLDEVSGTPIILHNGSFRVGYSADLVTFPAKGLAVIALCNYWSPSGAIPPVQVTHDIVASINPSLTRSDRAAASDPQPRLTNKLLNLLRGNDRSHGAAAVSAAFAHLPIPKHLPVKSLQYVSCRSVTDDPPTALGSHVTRECTYRVEMAGGPPTLTFLLTSSDEVAGLSLW